METPQNTNSVNLLKTLASPEFYNYYIKNIVPVIDEIEKHRKNCIAYMTLATVILSIILVYLIKFSVPVIPSLNEGKLAFSINFELLIQGAFIIAAIIPIYLFPIKRYRSIAKELFLSKLLGFLGNFEYYNYQCGLWTGLAMNMGWDDCKSGPFFVSKIKNLSLINDFNITCLDDNIRGVYNGLKVEIQEMDLKYESKSGKYRTVTKVFKGLLMSVEVLKPMKGRTILMPDMGMLNNLNDYSHFGMERVTLEDPAFEAIFEVYSTDQVESRYLLTTAFMDRMLKARRTNPTSGIKCEFVNGHMYMAFSSEKDWFELPVFTSAKKFQNYQRILCELSTLLSVIDTLKLEQNIGL